MQDNEYLGNEEFPDYLDNQYYGCDDDLEFSIPNDIEEFNEVSDDLEFSNSSLQEFSSGNSKEKDPKKRKRLLQRMIATFAAASVLVVPTVMQTMYISPDEPYIEPEPPVVEPGPQNPDGPVEVIEEYDITGSWTNGSEFFRFLEDETGYYYNGEYFVLLKWYKSGYEYHVYGGGLTGINPDAHSVDFWEIDSVTTMTTQGLILSSDTRGDNLYYPSEPGFDDSFVVSLLSIPAEQRMTGFWEYKETITTSPNIEDLAPSYYWITASTLTTDIGSETFHHYEHFELPYTAHRDFWIESAIGDYHIKFTEGSNSWEFINERFEFYYFVTINEECMLVDPFSGIHIMVKTETPEFFQG